jgi:hypothetical protein
MVTNNQCEIHRRVKVDPEDIPPNKTAEAGTGP